MQEGFLGTILAQLDHENFNGEVCGNLHPNKKKSKGSFKIINQKMSWHIICSWHIQSLLLFSDSCVYSESNDFSDQQFCAPGSSCKVNRVRVENWPPSIISSSCGNSPWSSRERESEVDIFVVKSKCEWYIGLSPWPVTVATKIIICLVEDAYKPLFATVTRRGEQPKWYIILFWIRRLYHQHECQEYKGMINKNLLYTTHAFQKWKAFMIWKNGGASGIFKIKISRTYLEPSGI